MKKEVRLYIGGTFDLLHSGHIALFKRCKELGYVIVSLNRDEFVTRYKREPILTFEHRKEILESCKYIDEVITNTGDEDSKISILSSKATHIVHGSDWSGDALMKQMGFDQKWLDINNIEMLYLSYTAGISTTDIINKIKGN